MGRPATDIDDQVIRMRNEQCSRHFLRLLRQHHGGPDDIEPEIEAEPAEPPIVESDYWHLMWCFDLVFRKPAPKIILGPQKVEDIYRATAREFGLTKIELTSDRRTKNVVLPRQLAMYLAKVLTDRSFPEIGRRMGGRDHSTAIHAFQKIDALVKIDFNLAARIEKIKASL